MSTQVAVYRRQARSQVRFPDGPCASNFPRALASSVQAACHGTTRREPQQRGTRRLSETPLPCTMGVLCLSSPHQGIVLFPLLTTAPHPRLCDDNAFARPMVPAGTHSTQLPKKSGSADMPRRGRCRCSLCQSVHCGIRPRERPRQPIRRRPEPRGSKCWPVSDSVEYARGIPSGKAANPSRKTVQLGCCETAERAGQQPWQLPIRRLRKSSFLQAKPEPIWLANAVLMLFSSSSYMRPP